jgi:hypothetical protein
MGNLQISPQPSTLEVARRLAFILATAKEENEQKNSQLMSENLLMSGNLS